MYSAQVKECGSEGEEEEQGVFDEGYKGNFLCWESEGGDSFIQGGKGEVGSGGGEGDKMFGEGSQVMFGVL